MSINKCSDCSIGYPVVGKAASQKVRLEQNSYFLMKLTKSVAAAALLGSAYGAALQTTNAASQCRCRPNDPCWPSQGQWASLNASVSGNLLTVQPVAHVCHTPGYDAAACNASMALSESSVWRDQNPGAVQWTNWEAWPERNETCSFNLPREIPCR